MSSSWGPDPRAVLGVGAGANDAEVLLVAARGMPRGVLQAPRGPEVRRADAKTL